VPATNVGQVMAIFLMMAGTFYMAMPLTAAASTFYNVHEWYLRSSTSSSVAPADSPDKLKKENISNSSRNSIKAVAGSLLKIQKEVDFFFAHMQKSNKIDNSSSSDESKSDEEEIFDINNSDAKFRESLWTKINNIALSLRLLSKNLKKELTILVGDSFDAAHRNTEE
jgi:hypothetical protein